MLKIICYRRYLRILISFLPSVIVIRLHCKKWRRLYCGSQHNSTFLVWNYDSYIVRHMQQLHASPRSSLHEEDHISSTIWSIAIRFRKPIVSNKIFITLDGPGTSKRDFRPNSFCFVIRWHSHIDCSPIRPIRACFLNCKRQAQPKLHFWNPRTSAKLNSDSAQICISSDRTEFYSFCERDENSKRFTNQIRRSFTAMKFQSLH